MEEDVLDVRGIEHEGRMQDAKIRFQLADAIEITFNLVSHRCCSLAHSTPPNSLRVPRFYRIYEDIYQRINRNM